MAHIKVWLVVCITIVLSGLVWSLPTQQEQRVHQLKQQLVPLQKSRDFHHRVYRYQQKLLKQTKELASHKQLEQALQPLAELTQKGSLRRRKWRERQAYRQVARSLQAHQSVLKGGAQQTLYLFAPDRRVLWEAGQVASHIHPPKVHPLSRLPMVESALQGKPQLGLWSDQDKPYFMISAPVYSTAATKDAKDNDDDAKPTPRKLVGVIFVKQAISQQIFADLGLHSKAQSSPLVILFNHNHPLFYWAPQDQKVVVKRQSRASSAPPPGTKASPQPEITVSPLLQQLQRWTARHMSQFSQEARQGTFSSSKPVFLQGQSYLYVVGRLLAPVSDGQVGYVMLHPVPQASQPFFQSPFFLLSLLSSIFAVFLGIWFSASWRRQQTVLRQLFAEFAEDPESLRSVKQLPSSFVFLFQYMRSIAHKQQHRVSASPSMVSAPTGAPEAQDVAPHRTSNSLDMIRALTEDGSMVMPHRPKGMTYIHKPEKEELESAPEPRSLILQANHGNNNSDLPSFISSDEAEDIVPSTAATSFSLGEARKTSDTPVPQSLDFSGQSAHMLESLVATAEPLSPRKIPSTPPMISPAKSPSGPASPLNPSATGMFMPGAPRPAEGSALLDMLQSGSTATPANKGPVAATHLPMVIHQPNDLATRIGKSPSVPVAPQLMLGEPSAQVQHQRNLSTELDSVFSMIADASAPAPHEPLPMHVEPAPAAMNEANMRRIFDEYLNVRRSCGEPTHNIQWDSFVELLNNQRSTILRQYGCKDVQFYVQEKNGRASLKATPVN